MKEGTSSGALWRRVTCQQLTERDRRNQWKAVGWLFVWMVSFVSVSLAIRHEVFPGGLWTYLAIAGSTALGVFTVLAYARFVREGDELQRKIQLEALALGFGGAFLAHFGFSLLERTGNRIDLGDPFLVMVVCYALGLFLGTRRYS
jgi:hypothetical protein